MLQQFDYAWLMDVGVNHNDNYVLLSISSTWAIVLPASNKQTSSFFYILLILSYSRYSH